MKRLVISMTFLLFATFMHAQIKKTIHQVFKLDTVEVIKIGLWEQSDTYIWEVEEWPSINVMIETNVSLNQASSAILNFMVEAKRYDVKIEENGEALTLRNELSERMEIKTAEGTSTEEIRLKIFMPDIYQREDATTWRKVIKKREVNNGELTRRGKND